MDIMAASLRLLYSKHPLFVFDYDRAKASAADAVKQFVALFAFANVTVHDIDVIRRAVDIHGGADRGMGHAG